ncbi:6-phosphogluconolactonase [Salinisphaera aquimarina]|uniref:6-phosphogluconolactonase n=1 Tax=Salinisphaera aquimarina TaxID=2094031 RepID=A0ABV7ETD9_9GAMM
MSELNAFDSRSQASETLAGRIAEHLRAGIDARGRASLALSGGSSPVELFERLSETELDWSSVTIVATDERWVAPSHEQSNEGMFRRRLLRGRAAAATLVSLYVDGRTAAGSLSIVTRRLAEMPSPFDAVVLGMGTDGHTASLFPDAGNIDAMLASRSDCVVPAFDDDRIERVSLGPTRLLETRALYLLFFGDDKRAVYDQALGDGPASQWPVRTALHQTRVPTIAYWAP